MKKILFVLIFVASAFGLQAQEFEGTLTWKITSEITDPDMKAQAARMKDPANQAKMKEMQEKMNDPQFKAMLEANPQMKSQIEGMVKAMANGGGLEALMPTGLTVKIKGKNTLSIMEGGAAAGMEVLYLNDKNQSYRIDRAAKTYSVLPAGKTDTKQDNAKVTKTTETRKILGYTCTKYVVDAKQGNDAVQQVFWTTTELKDIDFKSMSRQRLAQGQPDMFYEKIDGVPLRMEMKHPKGTMTLEATEVKRRALGAEEFVVPAGFRKV